MPNLMFRKSPNFGLLCARCRSDQILHIFNGAAKRNTQYLKMCDESQSGCNNLQRGTKFPENMLMSNIWSKHWSSAKALSVPVG